MSEIKIARFVDINACKSIFSEKSTFVLRSPEYYKRLYELSAGENTKGDRNEGCAKTIDDGTAEFTGFVMSCWTKIKGNEPTSCEWSIFEKDNQNILAIVSTPSKVCGFLEKTLEIKKESAKRRFPFFEVRHKEVLYKEVQIDEKNICDVVPFVKGSKFRLEQEYRFVLYYAWPEIIDSFIFFSGIGYLEKFFVNPKISKENKHKLRMILGNAMAGYGDFSEKQLCEIIADSNILFE